MSEGKQLRKRRYRKRKQQCRGKFQHVSERDAQAAARLMGNVDSHPMNVYRCEFCNHWHIGRIDTKFRTALRMAFHEVKKNRKAPHDENS